MTGASSASANGARRDLALIIGAMLVTAIPLLAPQLPPLADLPGHMGRWAIQLAGNDDFLSRHYAFEWALIGNLGFDLLIPPLAALVGLEAAVKLLTIATASGLAGAMLWAAKEAHGRIPPAAGFALPFVFAYPFQFGFVNYWLSLALAFAGLAIWLRLGTHRWRSAIFAALGFIIWLAHMVGWGVLCIVIFAAEIERLRATGLTRAAALRRTIIACLPLALPLVATLASAFTPHESARTFYEAFGRKFVWIGFALKDRWKAFDIASLAIILAVILSATVFKQLRFDRGLGLASLLLFAVLLATPFMLLGSAYADMRLVAPMLAIALLAISAQGRWTVVLAAGGAAFFAVRTAATAYSFTLHGAEVQAELAAIDAVPRNARVVAFVGQPCRARWKLSRTTHVPSMAIVRRHAFTNDQFAAAGAQLIRVRYRDAGAFSRDPSQMVVGENCPKTQWKRFAPMLAALPRDAFDYVWLINPPVDRDADLSGLAPVWSNGRSTLYRIIRRESPPATPRTASAPARSGDAPPRKAR